MKSGHAHHNHYFLGRVRISGASVPVSESEASVQRYPLDKRGVFSHIRGDIALRVYLVHDPSSILYPPEGQGFKVENRESWVPPLEEINPNIVGNYEEVAQEREFGNENNHIHNKKKKKQREKEQVVRTFYSIPAKNHTSPAPQTQPPPPTVEVRADYMKAAPPPAAMMMQVPMKKPEYEVIETRPPVGANMGYRRGDTTGSTYDLVEQMNYLYVRVVKAGNLPRMDITGSLDPYVEAKLGNYKGVTKHLEKNQNPVWNQVFAFSKDRLQSSVLEVTVKDKDIGKDDFVGRVAFDMNEIPVRVPPDSPLAPQWYKLEDKKGERSGDRGEIMLAVWMGTQADEAFPEAWHSDAHSISHHNLANTRSKVYFSPKLYYLRVHVDRKSVV